MKRALFTGAVTPEGSLTLCVTFLGQGQQRFHIHDHRTGETLRCRNVPITTLTPDGLCDSNEAPPLKLVKGARFTVLAYAQGKVVTGATYEFDGQVILERSQIGEPIRMMCQVNATAPVIDASDERTQERQGRTINAEPLDSIRP